MNSKSHQYPKISFINWSKSILTLYVFFAILGIASGQTSNKDKNKTTKNKDSVAKTKGTPAKTENTIAIIDTIKKISPFLDQKEVGLDSLFTGSGKFKLFKKGAHASYYADKFHNRKTASGKKYDKNKYTAAHKKLPFGTIIKVTNEANGKSVLVEINDRGPFVRSREIDLSRKAFMEITGNKASGNMNVILEILQK